MDGAAFYRLPRRCLEAEEDVGRDLDRLFADVGPLDEGPVRVRVNISIVR